MTRNRENSPMKKTNGPHTYSPRLQTLESRLQPGGAVLGEWFGAVLAELLMPMIDSPILQAAEMSASVRPTNAAHSTTHSLDLLDLGSLKSWHDAPPAVSSDPGALLTSAAAPSNSPVHASTTLSAVFPAQGAPDFDAVGESSAGSRTNCLAPGTFRGLVVVGTHATDITPDGCTVVGVQNGAFKWTQENRLMRLGGAGGVVSVSSDSSVVSGDVKDSANKTTAGRWTQAGSWQSLGGLEGSTGCDNNLSNAYATSGDGAKVVGLAWLSNCRARAFVWEQSTGMVDLGSLGPNSSRASGIFADGSTIGGFDEHPTQGFRQSAVWKDGVETVLTDTPSELYSATPDGGIVVGKGSATEGAARWTEDDGVWTPEYFGNLP